MLSGVFSGFGVILSQALGRVATAQAIPAPPSVLYFILTTAALQEDPLEPREDRSAPLQRSSLAAPREHGESAQGERE